MNFKQLHEEFIQKANRPMTLGALPVQPKESQAPVIPVERWKNVNGALYKTYKFRRLEDRNLFIVNLLSYEQSIEHNAEIVVSEQQVDLKLQTKDLGHVTELDKEYARYADVLFRDLVYSLNHE